MPLFFHSSDRHPDILNRQIDSTAAGRYQIPHGLRVDYQAVLKLREYLGIAARSQL